MLILALCLEKQITAHCWDSLGLISTQNPEFTCRTTPANLIFIDGERDSCIKTGVTNTAWGVNAISVSKTHGCFCHLLIFVEGAQCCHGRGYLYAFILVCKVCKKEMLVSILYFPISLSIPLTLLFWKRSVIERGHFSYHHIWRKFISGVFVGVFCVVVGWFVWLLLGFFLFGLGFFQGNWFGDF